jgi:hypothetical protein
MSDTFQWPDGKRAAVSLSFDDSRPSQVDNGVPILDSFGVRGTFYTIVPAAQKRLEAWRSAVARGHEMGNHTVNHPCTCNFWWNKVNMLEEYTLEKMDAELAEASANIERALGVRPRSFAYPCGEKFVGRGEATRSYVPLVAKHFLAGRGFRNEATNDPIRCDLAQLTGIDGDDQSFEALKKWFDEAVERNTYLVLVFHDVGVAERQRVTGDTLKRVCEYATNPANGLWADTVANVAAYLKERRG